MKVVIVGGGFGGLRLARKLNNQPGFEITLLDRFNYHQFQPLFYQVATAGLDASNISFPLRKAFHKSKNVRIRLGELREVNATLARTVSELQGQLRTQSSAMETLRAFVEQNEQMMETLVDSMNLVDDLGEAGPVPTPPSDANTR